VAQSSTFCSCEFHYLSTTLPFQIYQITAHKIQVFDESDRTTEPRLIPQLPGGATDEDENAKTKKNDDLLTTFTAKEKNQDGDRLNSTLLYLSHM
jgi:hypothetical protein